MQNKIKFLICILFFVAMLCFAFYLDLKEEPEEQPQYSGPVPLGFDESHYRQTGETIKLNKVDLNG